MKLQNIFIGFCIFFIVWLAIFSIAEFYNPERNPSSRIYLDDLSERSEWFGLGGLFK